MDKITYKTKGVCSSSVSFVVTEGIVKEVSFMNGCTGNLKAISQLIEGMEVTEAIHRLRGIDCDGKGTSCADQLARALEKAMQEMAKDLQAG
jgi:uncharacterized protein (TIGR03905 family)